MWCHWYIRIELRCGADTRAERYNSREPLLPNGYDYPLRDVAWFASQAHRRTTYSPEKITTETSSIT